MPLTLQTFWKFTRPHTIYGTALSLLGIWLLATAQLGWSGQGLVALLVAEVSCLAANVTITGLNQLTDVEIDRINKPDLPVASGALSVPAAATIVTVCALLALALAGATNRFLLATVGTSLLIGTAYSLPPLRLKRFPLFAALCIFTVRGLVVNFGLWWYFLDAGGLQPGFAPSILCLSLFVTLFTAVIALFKDLPDTEGDRRYEIATFSLQLGRQVVFDLCSQLLVATYLLVAAASAPHLSPAGLLLVIGLHSGALVLFGLRRSRVDLKDNAQVYDCYQFIWKLYYVEYLVFPLAWLAG